LKVLVFGMLVEDIGSQEIDITFPADLAELRQNLLEQFPALENKQFMIAVNMQKAEGNIVLNPTDEIALIPPFAGG
jgi:molybdopterin synthase sulfur carrier subunit